MNADPRPVPGRPLQRAPRRTGAALLAVVLLGALGACGGGDEEAADPAASTSPSESPSESPSDAPSSPEVPAGTPDCGEVWTEGATIPRSYAGCAQDGVLVADDSLACSSGQRLVTFEDRFYGVAGGEVRVSEQSLDDDPDYGSSVRSCRA